MNTILIQYYKTDIGELVLGSFEDKLCLCDWRYRRMRTSVDKRIQDFLHADYQDGSSLVLELTQKQLSEYFNGNRKDFDIPLLMAGTEFQQTVWNELLKIPYGQTMTYLGLSKSLHNEKAIRAVASANGANALSIVVPCHRIIGSKGELVGYAGGLPAKKKLLQLEQGNKAEQLELF